MQLLPFLFSFLFNRPISELFHIRLGPHLNFVGLAAEARLLINQDNDNDNHDDEMMIMMVLVTRQTKD